MAHLASTGQNLCAEVLVKVTTYLSDRRYGAENREVRRAVLAGRMLASTVVIAGIYDETWLLEIEAVATA